MSTLLLVPSRSRPKQLADLTRSVLQSSQADVAVYIDQDQEGFYGWLKDPAVPKRIKTTVGLRIGPVAAANYLVSLHPGYDAYGFVCDDCTLTVPRWDEHVEQALGPHFWVTVPSHTGAELVDFPMVNQHWIKTMGWYAPPSFYHWGWPSVIGALAEAAGCIHYAKPHEFWVQHARHSNQNKEAYPADMLALYDYLANRFGEDLRRLRESYD